jgi:RNA polymerase sigma-70 factor (ECF subfamily)
LGSRRRDERLHEWIDKGYSPVWRTLRRLGVRPSELDDAVQEVFMVFARRVTVIEHGKERAFLLQTAVNVAHHRRRSVLRRRETGDESELDHAVDDRQDPELALSRRDAVALVDKLLDRIPMEFREAFVLFELEEMSVTEVAATLSIPRGTAASRIRRGRQRFLELAREVLK